MVMLHLVLELKSRFRLLNGLFRRFQFHHYVNSTDGGVMYSAKIKVSAKLSATMSTVALVTYFISTENIVVGLTDHYLVIYHFITWSKSWKNVTNGCITCRWLMYQYRLWLI